jgi:hypothetical protein
MQTAFSHGPADVATLHDATTGLPWPEYSRVSDSLKAEGVEYNARVAKVKSDLRKSFEGFEAALNRISEGCEAATYGELFATVETCKIDRTSTMTELASLWTNRETLANKAYAELAALIPDAEKNLNDTVDAVIADLEKIGSGLAAQRASQTEAGLGEVAERQLRWQARYANLRSLAAAAELADIRSQAAAASDQRGFSKVGRATADKFIRTVARRMLATA